MAKMKKTIVAGVVAVAMMGTLANSTTLQTFISDGIANFVEWTSSVQSGISNNRLSIDKIVLELSTKSGLTQDQIITLIMDNAPTNTDAAAVVTAVNAAIDAGLFTDSTGGGTYNIASLDQISQALSHIYGTANNAQRAANDAHTSIAELTTQLNVAFTGLSFTPPEVIADFR